MKKSMIISTVTVLIAAIVLAIASFTLSAAAKRNIESEHISMMQTLLPGSIKFEREEYQDENGVIDWVYRGENGYVLQTTTDGYVEDIVLMVGVTFDGKVTGVVIRDLQETLGLGAQALSNSNFLAQFIFTSGEAEVGSTVDAITGATVTSKAITKGVNSAVAFVTGADISSGATEWGGR